MFRALPIISLVMFLSACNLYLVENSSSDLTASTMNKSAEATVSEAPPPPPPKPVAGSDLIGFMDKTTAQLEGCRF